MLIRADLLPGERLFSFKSHKDRCSSIITTLIANDAALKRLSRAH